jgi:GT2 family glycosyltransferase
MKPNILIACPIRNRAWILLEYLTHLQNLNYPKENIAFHFVVNDSTDDTKKMLRTWKNCYEKYYRYIKISEINFGVPKDLEEGEGRDGSVKITQTRHNYTYKTLSILRNLILDFADFDETCSYLFSVDSDILVNPETVNDLLMVLSTNKDIVGSCISNGGRCFNFLPLSGKREIIPENQNPFEVRLTGACMMVSRKVFSNKKIRYSPENSGEDEGFCKSAKALGFKSYVYVDPRGIQKHIMRKEEKEQLCKKGTVK